MWALSPQCGSQVLIGSTPSRSGGRQQEPGGPVCDLDCVHRRFRQPRPLWRLRRAQVRRVVFAVLALGACHQRGCQRCCSTRERNARQNAHPSYNSIPSCPHPPSPPHLPCSGSAAADWVQDHLIDYVRYSMLMVRNGTASDGEAASFVAPAGSVPDANGNGPDGVNTNDGSGADGVPADLVTTLDGPHRAVEYAIRRAFLQCDRVFLQVAELGCGLWW